LLDSLLQEIKMLGIALRLLRHPCSNQSLQNKVLRLNARCLSDENKDDNLEKEIVAVIKANEKEAMLIKKANHKLTPGERLENHQVFFSDEEKEIMQIRDQRIPFTFEKEPGVFCYENAVRPKVTFPDPTFTELKLHEEVREYSLGYPVIRPPAVADRLKQGFKLTPPNPVDYPWIQEFRSHYDYLIVGGGIIGSCIANALAERIKPTDGFRIGVIEKDPTYRRSNSTQFLGGLRNQFSMPESIEAGLFAADYLRLMGLNKSVPMDQDLYDGNFNTPAIKLQPHGHLTLFPEGSGEKLDATHKIQAITGAQTAIMSKKNLERRFPWLNTNGLEGGCLGLESEGWCDTWNFLQSIILRNKYLGVDYIHGEVVYMKNHCWNKVENDDLRVFEAHVLLPESKRVFPIEFAKIVIAAAGQSGKLGRMAGIGTGRGPLYMDIPVEPRRGYIFEVECKEGPGLNFPLLSDPSGIFIRRDGYLNRYLIGKLPDPDNHEEKIPQNMYGDVDPDYFEQVIIPAVQYRIPGFKNYTLMGSRPVDYDYNYEDGSPIIGIHPIVTEVMMATGFNGRGAMYGPAVGRAITELILDDGYETIDFSRMSFDRFLERLESKEDIYA